MEDYFDQEGIRRQKFSLFQDFMSSNPLRKCFDYKIGKEKIREDNQQDQNIESGFLS